MFVYIIKVIILVFLFKDFIGFFWYEKILMYDLIIFEDLVLWFNVG